MDRQQLQNARSVDIASTLCTRAFLSMLAFQIIACFAINYGGEYAALTGWGKHPLQEKVYMWKVSKEYKTKNTVAGDLLGTAFLVAFFVTLGNFEASMATVRGADVRNACGSRVKPPCCGATVPPLPRAVLFQCPWMCFPLRVRRGWLRALIMGFEVLLTYGLLTIAVLMACGVTDFEGGNFCWFKGAWSTGAAVIVFTANFVGCAAEGNFEELKPVGGADGAGYGTGV